MSTVGSLIVKIGANVRSFVTGMQEAGRQAKETADSISGDMNNMSANTQQMTTKTGKYMSVAQQQWRQMREAMRKAEQEVRQDFENLSASAETFAGKNDQFISSIEALGLKQKKMTDNFIANNEAMKVSFLQSTGAIMARTNSAVKTMEHIERVGNPIRKLDTVFLGVANRLETMGKNGQAAVVALRELGPTANMKQLSDLTMLINQRLMGIQMLQLGAGLVTAGELYLLVKLASTVDESLIPAFEKFKEVWLDALRPFGEMMSDVFKSVLQVGTAFGEFFVSLNNINPVITQMIFGFMALLPPLLLLLAPLAIGISATGSFAAAFGALWTMIGPVVTAFLAVIGTVMLVSAVIVGLIAVWNQMWDASENLRNTVSYAWDNIKTAVLSALAPLFPMWEKFKQAFLDLIQTFTGASSMSDFWTKMGDVTAIFIQWFCANAVPMLKAALDLVVLGITTLMDIGIKIFNAIKSAWDSDLIGMKTIIMDTFETVKSTIENAFKFVTATFKAFHSLFTGDWTALWENVKTMANTGWELIKNIIELWLVGRILKIFKAWGDSIGRSTKEIMDGMKTKINDGLETIRNFFQTKFEGILSFVNGLKEKFFDAGRGLVDMIVDGLTSAWSRVTDTMSTLMQGIRDFLPFSPSKVGPLRDLNKLDFANPIKDSIFKATPIIQAGLGNMLALPTSNGVSSNHYGGNVININITGGSTDEILEKLERKLARLGIL